MDGVLLDVALGLAVLFLGFAVVVTATVEGASRVFGWRSANLWAWFRNSVEASVDGADSVRSPALASKAATQDAAFLVGRGARWSVESTSRAGQLQQEIRDLTMRARGRINAVSKRDFGRAVLNLLLPEDDSTIDDAIARAEGWPDSVPMKTALLRILREAEGRREAVVDRVGDWFDQQMVHVGDVYSRNMKVISIACGLVLAVVFNLNALNAFDVLEGDAALRQAGADAGQAIADKCRTDEGSGGDGTTDGGEASGDPAVNGADRNEAPPAEDTKDCVLSEADALFRSQDLVNIWGLWDDDVVESRRFQTGIWLPIGLGISALAIGLGAPFWLDTIKRIAGRAK